MPALNLCAAIPELVDSKTMQEAEQTQEGKQQVREEESTDGRPSKGIDELFIAYRSGLSRAIKAEFQTVIVIENKSQNKK